MPLTVLGDKDVNRILHSLTRDDILQLQESLADALHWYSTSNDANDCCSDCQPERTVLPRKDGSTSLFMPASGLTGQGVKVINITPPDTSNLPALAEALSLSSQDTRSTGSGSPRSSIAPTESSGTSTTSFASSGSTLATSFSGESRASSLSAASTAGKSTIRGSLTLLDSLGHTTGLINAEEVTAFRTALASTILLNKRHKVHDVTVFGAGKQAYWHARLALLLRGSEIHHLNIITRNFETARRCLHRLYDPLPDDPEYVNPLGGKYNSKTKIAILTPAHTEYARLLKETVRASHVLFCTTPSTTPLFPGTFLTNPEGRKRGRYIACIGSYKPHMVELDPAVLRHAVTSPESQPHSHRPHLHHRAAREGGAVIVDTVSGSLREAGEVIQAGLKPEQVVELGELFMLKRDAERRRKEQEAAKKEVADHEKVASGGGCHLAAESGLREWLTKGNVIYKSVGLGLMDVVVGNELVRLANERGVGTRIDDF